MYWFLRGDKGWWDSSNGLGDFWKAFRVQCGLLSTDKTLSLLSWKTGLITSRWNDVSNCIWNKYQIVKDHVIQDHVTEGIKPQKVFLSDFRGLSLSSQLSIFRIQDSLNICAAHSRESCEEASVGMSLFTRPVVLLWHMDPSQWIWSEMREPHEDKQKMLCALEKTLVFFFLCYFTLMEKTNNIRILEVLLCVWPIKFNMADSHVIKDCSLN